MNDPDLKPIQRSFPANTAILISRIARYAPSSAHGIVSKNPLCINLI